MYQSTQDFAQLTLLIVRLQDAEMLLDTEADALLAEVQAAQAAREQGEKTAPQHLAIVAGVVQALVDARALTVQDGRAVIETAQNLAAQDA